MAAPPPGLRPGRRVATPLVLALVAVSRAPSPPRAPLRAPHGRSGLLRLTTGGAPAPPLSRPGGLEGLERGGLALRLPLLQPPPRPAPPCPTLVHRPAIGLAFGPLATRRGARLAVQCSAVLVQERGGCRHVVCQCMPTASAASAASEALLGPGWSSAAWLVMPQGSRGGRYTAKVYEVRKSPAEVAARSAARSARCEGVGVEYCAPEGRQAGPARARVPCGRPTRAIIPRDEARPICRLGDAVPARCRLGRRSLIACR